MACGLVGSYGTLAAMAARSLVPTQPRAKIWMFAAELSTFREGRSVDLVDPSGRKIVIVRYAEKGSVEDFAALSSTCPHLGCQVHWDPQQSRFHCPCHNGSFDREGKATGGPPAAAGQSLAHYPLKVENGLLFIEVPGKGLELRRES